MTVFAAGIAAGQATFVEWAIPTPNSQPHCVVSDSKGRIWYAGIGANTVGVLDPATGEIRELRPPTPGSGPHGIAIDDKDVVWFTEQSANRIGRVDPVTFQITEYPVPTANSGPHTPIFDGRGAIWFTEQRGNRIGRLKISTGEVEEFPIPTPNSGPYGIVADAEGNAWFCSFGAGSNRIGRVDARTGVITEYATPTPNSGPRRPWIDSSGKIWIVENRAHKLARFDPLTERFREWDTPSRNGEPYGIVVDREDKIWYNEFAANTIVRFDPATEQFTVFPLPVEREQIRIVAIDPANRLWWGNNGNNRLGVLLTSAAAVNAASFRGETLAAGAMISVFGERLAASTEQATTLPLPKTLGSARVTVQDIEAPVFFASPGQINAQLPLEVTEGTAWMRVVHGPMTLSQQVRIAVAAPGIFTANQRGTGPGIIAHAADFRLVTESTPAREGDFVAIFCTGLGRFRQPVASGSAPPIPPPETAVLPEVRIANQPSTVTYAGAAPGFPGLYQVNVRVPANVPPGDQPLQIVAGGAASNVVTIAVR